MSTATPDQKQKLYLFNCAQRAHGNFLEHAPFVLPTMLVVGTAYPVTAAALGMIWNAGRIVYATGYTRADRTEGQGRLMGSFGFVGEFGLLGMLGFMGVKMLI